MTFSFIIDNFIFNISIKSKTSIFNKYIHKVNTMVQSVYWAVL
jgi:hypothetical protein